MMMKKNIYIFFFSFYFIALFSVNLLAGELRWAADVESGAPYSFYRMDQPTQMTGFEYEIVQSLAQKLKKKPVFVQNSWDGLIMGLKSGLYDIAINGIEITEERKKEILFSEPYYITHLSLINAVDGPQFQDLASLVGHKVGTLTNSAAEQLLKTQHGVDVRSYDSETLAHQDLLVGRVESLLFDEPIALYFSKPNSKLKVQEKSFGQIEYAIATTKENVILLSQINSALQEMKSNGELKRILQRWSLWNKDTAVLFNDPDPNIENTSEEYENYKSMLTHGRSWSEKLEIYQNTLPLILKSAWQTVKISICAMIIAVFFGLVLVSLRLYGNQFFKFVVVSFVELVRGTPLLLQLFFIFYALPSLGVQISAFWAAVIGLGLNYSVQESEIYRSGLLSIHRNQVEAAKMLGLSSWQTFWNVQAPQAFRVCLPPLTTDFIALIKDSSLVSVITLVELTKTYSVLSATYYDYIGFAVITAIVYLLIGLPLVFLSKRLERRMVAG